jgi:hypothetical protein
MNTRLAALAGALVLAGGLAGCAMDRAYYGPPPPYADMEYDAYYDGAYGPFNGGYWGPDSQFYYWSPDHQHYHRDVAGHFQRQGRTGFNAVHGRAPAATRRR